MKLNGFGKRQDRTIEENDEAGYHASSMYCLQRAIYGRVLSSGPGQLTNSKTSSRTAAVYYHRAQNDTSAWLRITIMLLWQMGLGFSHLCFSWISALTTRLYGFQAPSAFQPRSEATDSHTTECIVLRDSSSTWCTLLSFDLLPKRNILSSLRARGLLVWNCRRRFLGTT